MLLATLLALAAQPQSQPGFRELDYTRALAAAKTEQKLVLLDFHAAKSPDSDRMASTTWPSPITQMWLQSNFVAIHVDADTDHSTAERYQVTATPTILICDATGLEADRIAGFIAPMDLLERAKPIIQGAPSLCAARATLATDPKNPALHAELARTCRRFNLNQRALEEYLIAWDLGASVPAFRGERDALVPYELAVLARSFKPAQRALTQRCTDARAQIVGPPVEGVDYVRIAHDLAILNDFRGKSDETLALREELAKREKPPAAVFEALFTDGVAKLLHHERRYEEMLAGRGDALAYVEELTRRIGEQQKALELRKNAAEDHPELPPVAALDTGANDIGMDIASCAMYFEAFVGTGRVKEADALLETLLTVASSGETFARLVTASGRAGDEELARAIGARGLKQLTEKNEQLFVKQALSNLDGKTKRF